MANYSIKSIDQTKYGDYQCFGWVRSKRDYAEEGVKTRSKAPQMYVKRRNGFSYNPRLCELENNYEKLSKKKRHKAAAVIVGIIFFILMVAFLAVTGVELYYGISKGIDLTKYPATYYFYNNNGEKVESDSIELVKGEWKIGEQKGVIDVKRGRLEFSTVTGEGDNEVKTLYGTAVPKSGVLTFTKAAATPVTTKYFADACKLEKKVSVVSDTEEVVEDTSFLGKIKSILDKVHDQYLSKVTGLFDGKTNETTGEYTDGIADKVGNLIPAIAGFISADTLVGLIALILFIICLIIFCECSAKTGKKFAKRQAQIAAILAEAKATVHRMKENDMSLMNKGERKMYMWETVISNGIRKANGGDEDDDD